MLMSFYKNNKKEVLTIQLISQILGKIKLNCAPQEPQWAHVTLDITTRGFSTGTIKCNNIYFEIEANLANNIITIRTTDNENNIQMTDGKSVRDYYYEIITVTQDLGLDITINTTPQEMETKTPFEADTDHHHYNSETALKILKWFQFAKDTELKFIAPLRNRKVYPGLFWGTFDVSCILVFNSHEPFPDDSKVIERAAFDEHMVEFGFWLGDDHFDHPTFFVLPYPFVSGEELQVTDDFPGGSYFSSEMAEYVLEIKTEIDSADSEEILRFFHTALKQTAGDLDAPDVNYIYKELKMEANLRSNRSDSL